MEVCYSSILINNVEFNVVIKISKKYKRLAMSLNEEFAIVIRAPLFININDISKFISSNSFWIIRTFENKRKYSMINLKDDYIYLFGVKHHINWIETSGNFKFSFDETTINLYVRQKTSKKENIIKFLIKNYKDLVFKKLLYWSKIMNLDFDNFQFKWAETSFGKCFHNRKTIAISPRICLYSENLIDYLIIHELSHLIHPNHSSEFWNNVEKYYKDYKTARKYLKKHY